MASPTSSAAPSSAPDPPAAAAAHPLPRPSFVSPPLRPPPLFSPQPLLGKPLNPPPPPPPQGFLYHHRGFPPRPAARPPPAAADQAVSVASPTGYIRNATPTAVMTFAAVTQARPFVYGTSDQMVAQVHVPIHHVRPPPAPSAQQSAAPLVVPRPTVAAAGPPQSIPVAALPKSNIGDAEKLLPRPLPASMIDSQVMKQHENDAETEVIEEEEPVGSVEELSEHCERNVFGGLNGANRDLPYSFLPQVSLAEMRLLHEIGWRLGVCYDPKIGISHQLYIFPFIPRQHEKALSPDG
ncbi:hypothetical protein MUK42_05685 [Musa troglodytarum]|uniref:Uncharacterized protein n=1 Tax=Musa troglodytarum TaxID=320322 RepID=A0A9E7KE67_9LILI|nr:hypothetical protein MUK42_05685 [Musa troglodytarum]